MLVHGRSRSKIYTLIDYGPWLIFTRYINISIKVNFDLVPIGTDLGLKLAVWPRPVVILDGSEPIVQTNQFKNIMMLELPIISNSKLKKHCTLRSFQEHEVFIFDFKKKSQKFVRELFLLISSSGKINEFKKN